jgi:hypothetical protein
MNLLTLPCGPKPFYEQIVAANTSVASPFTHQAKKIDPFIWGMEASSVDELYISSERSVISSTESENFNNLKKIEKIYLL